jgi:hypothetical protein
MFSSDTVSAIRAGSVVIILIVCVCIRVTRVSMPVSVVACVRVPVLLFACACVFVVAYCILVTAYCRNRHRDDVTRRNLTPDTAGNADTLHRRAGVSLRLFPWSGKEELSNGPFFRSVVLSVVYAIVVVTVY